MDRRAFSRKLDHRYVRRKNPLPDRAWYHHVCGRDCSAGWLGWVIPGNRVERLCGWGIRTVVELRQEGSKLGFYCWDDFLCPGWVAAACIQRHSRCRFSRLRVIQHVSRDEMCSYSAKATSR